jgi:hypothetical protein
LLLEQYRIMIDTSEKLMERRQETVNLHTTLCTILIVFVGTVFAFNEPWVCALEKTLPTEIFQCEYRYNNLNGIRSFSVREKWLPIIFMIVGGFLCWSASGLQAGC